MCSADNADDDDVGDLTEMLNLLDEKPPEEHAAVSADEGAAAVDEDGLVFPNLDADMTEDSHDAIKA